MIATIGAPAIIAALTIAPRTRTNIVRQIKLLEILVRKLLLAEVAALSKPPPQRGPHVTEIALRATGLYVLPETRRSAKEAAPRGAIDLSKPESWPARFALAIPRDQRAVSNRNAPRIRSLERDSARRSPVIERAPMLRHSEAFLVARRTEALRRVLHNPAPYVTRLSRASRIGSSPSRHTIQRYALTAPRRFIGDRVDPRLTLDVFTTAIRAHAILTDTS